MRSKTLAFSTLALVAAALAFFLYGLLDKRLAHGDVYPQYSGLRADPLGTRALYETCRALPGREAVLWMRPFEELELRPPVVLLRLGVNPGDTALPGEELRQLQKVARDGGRVVLAFAPQAWRDLNADAKREAEVRRRMEQITKRKVEEDDADADAEPTPDPEAKKDMVPVDGGTLVDMTAWDLALKFPAKADETTSTSNEEETDEPLVQIEKPVTATRLAWAQPGFDFPPLAVTTATMLVAGDPKEWRPIFKRGDAVLAVVRPFGAGEVIVLADSYPLSNEALFTGMTPGKSDERNTPFLVWLLGDQTRVIFDEHALGVVRGEGVGTLARRYNLHAALAMLVIIAALFVWRNATALVPAVEAGDTDGEVVSGLGAGGLSSLLRRAVPPQDLLQICHETWLRQAGRRLPGGVRDSIASVVRAEQALPANKRRPREAYHAIHEILNQHRHL